MSVGPHTLVFRSANGDVAVDLYEFYRASHLRLFHESVGKRSLEEGRRPAGLRVGLAMHPGVNYAVTERPVRPGRNLRLYLGLPSPIPSLLGVLEEAARLLESDYPGVPWDAAAVQIDRGGMVVGHLLDLLKGIEGVGSMIPAGFPMPGLSRRLMESDEDFRRRLLGTAPDPETGPSEEDRFLDRLKGKVAARWGR